MIDITEKEFDSMIKRALDNNPDYNILDIEYDYTPVKHSRKTKKAIAKIMACIFAQTGIVSSADYNINEESIVATNETRSTYLSSARSTLDISGTTATCKSTATGGSSVTQIIGDMYLMKYTSSGWQDIDAWRLQQGGNDYSNTKTKTGLSSGSYRLRTEFTVTASNGATETVTAYSGVKVVSSTSSSG